MDNVTFLRGRQKTWKIKKIPYLCGGTLFFLLVQTKKPRTNAREREKGVKDHLSDPEMMEGLIQAITGNYTCVQGGSLKRTLLSFVNAKLMAVCAFHSMITLLPIVMTTM